MNAAQHTELHQPLRAGMSEAYRAMQRRASRLHDMRAQLGRKPALAWRIVDAQAEQFPQHRNCTRMLANRARELHGHRPAAKVTNRNYRWRNVQPYVTTLAAAGAATRLRSPIKGWRKASGRIC